MPLVTPLPSDHNAEVAELATFFNETLGFCPNSVLTMLRRPEIAQAFMQLNKAVMVNAGRLTSEQKRLIGLAPDLRNLLLAINASALYVGMSLGAAAGSQAWLHLGPGALPAVALLFVACSMASFARSRRAERGPSVALAGA